MFIHPSIKKVNVFSDPITGWENRQNKPVNLQICKKPVPGTHYDGYGGIYPVIRFRGLGIKWIFPINRFDLRDNELQRLYRL